MSRMTKHKCNVKNPRKSTPSATVSDGLERRALALPKGVLLDAERALFRLRESGQRVSLSAFIEVAIRELLRRSDLGDLLRRHGASARRKK